MVTAKVSSAPGGIYALWHIKWDVRVALLTELVITNERQL